MLPSFTRESKEKDVGAVLEAVAKKLWKRAAIKTVPGELMGRDDVNGKNPGKPYLRIALVYEPKVTELGLTRMVKTLFG